MNLKSKAVLSIITTVIFVGLAIFLWAYKTGKITIFGSQTAATATETVQGFDLNNGTADQNVDLSGGKIQLKKTGDEESLAWLRINTQRSAANNSYTIEEVQKPFVGISMTRDSGNHPPFPVSIAEYFTPDSNLLSPASLLLQNIVLGDSPEIFTTGLGAQSFPQNYGIQTLQDSQQEVKFLNSTGGIVGKLFWDINGKKEKYWGINFFDWIASFHEPYMALLGSVTPHSAILAYSPKIEEFSATEASNLTCNELTLWWDRYIDDIKSWRVANKIKTVVAKDENGETLGTPYLLWDGVYAGDYLGYLQIRHITAGSDSLFGSAILTSAGMYGLKKATCAPQFGMPPPPQTTINGGLTIDELKAHNPQVVIKTQKYPDSGTYQYTFPRNSQNLNVSKLTSFEPINPQTPGSSKIAYQFAGSADNQTWSEWSAAVENALSAIDLSSIVPANSKYLKAKIILINKEGLPTLDGFKINYEGEGAIVDTQSPTAPTDFKVEALSCSKIKLSWKPAADNVGVAGYKIYNAANGELISQTIASVVELEITGTQPNTSYSYQVKAVDAANNLSAAATASVTTPPCAGGEDTSAPTAPTNASAQALSCNQTKLTWNASTDNVGVAGYTVFNATNNNQITTTADTNLTINGLAEKTTYKYYLKAHDAKGNVSEKSNEASIATPSCSGTQASSTSANQIAKLVSTGTVLWFNILIALLGAGAVSWILLRKKPL